MRYFRITLLVLSINFYALAYADMFSSPILNDIEKNIIVKDSRAIMQTRHRNVETIEEEGGVRRTVIITDPSRQQNYYEYSIPINGCYELQNGYRFCIKEGTIVDVWRKRNPLLDVSDKFFYEQTDICNQIKFEIIYSFFIQQQRAKFDEYQITSSYPLVNRVIVWHSNKIGKYRAPKAKKLAFFISELNDAGCIPVQKLMFYEDTEAQMYPMHIAKYKLLGPFTKKTPINRLFLVVDNANVIFYKDPQVDNLANGGEIKQSK